MLKMKNLLGAVLTYAEFVAAARFGLASKTRGSVRAKIKSLAETAVSADAIAAAQVLGSNLAGSLTNGENALSLGPRYQSWPEFR